MKLLFIGDVVGEPGRRAVRLLLPKLRERHQFQFVIANGENSAGGNGITSGTARDLFEAGVDVITSGDHVWDQKEVMNLLEQDPRVLRPLNYPPNVVGRGCAVIKKEGLHPVAVLNLQGRTFMPPLENPFVVVHAELDGVRRQSRIIVVDFHAEATSEKIALGRFLDGRVTAVLGTHTHVQTADEQIFPGGTAYLSDAGFTGPHESVLGREIEPVLRRFLTGLPQRFEVAGNRILLQGALIEVDEESGLAIRIERVSEPLT